MLRAILVWARPHLQSFLSTFHLPKLSGPAESLYRDDVIIVGLFSLHHLHFTGEVGAEEPGYFLRLLPPGIGPEIDGYHLRPFQPQVGEELLYQSREGGGTGHRTAVQDGDGLSLFYGQLLKAGGAGGPGNLHRLYLLAGLLHGLDIDLQGGLVVQGQDGGHPLGDAGGGDHLYLLLGQGAGLLGGEDNIGVVGQDDDPVRGDGLNGRGELPGAGVHGLPPRDDGGGPQALEDLEQALPRDHHYCGQGQGGGPGMAHLQIGPVLVIHIPYLDGVEHPLTDGRAQDLPGVKGVDVDPEVLLIPHHHQRLPLFFQLLAEPLRVQLFPFQKELGAVAIGFFLFRLGDNDGDAGGDDRERQGGGGGAPEPRPAAEAASITPVRVGFWPTAFWAAWAASFMTVSMVPSTG